MYIENKSLREAYALLENTTPLGRNDCGSVCDAYCCSDALGDSMELFPYEKEIFEKLDGFEVVDGEIPAVKCNGTCERETRPLACRIFPFFPYVTSDGRIKVIPDIRGVNICPLISHFDEVKFDRGFLYRVKKVGRLLYADEECRKFLVDTSREIDLLISLMES